MPAVKDVGEPCAGEPHARIEVAAGGNQISRAQTAARSRRLPPTRPPRARLLGELAVGHLILEPGDCQAKGLIENRGRHLRSNFEPGRSSANELDCQDQLDRWCDEANARRH